MIERRTQDHFAASFDRVGKGSVPRGVGTWLIENHVVKDESRIIRGQTIQKPGVQFAVPDIERLVELIGGIFVQINENDLVGLEVGAQQKRNVVTQTDNWLTKGITETAKTESQRQEDAERNRETANQMSDLSNFHPRNSGAREPRTSVPGEARCNS